LSTLNSSPYIDGVLFPWIFSLETEYQFKEGLSVQKVIIISLWRAISSHRFEIEIGGRATRNAAPALPTITSNQNQNSKAFVFEHKG
jgi:hypothetical protein